MIVSLTDKQKKACEQYVDMLTDEKLKHMTDTFADGIQPIIITLTKERPDLHSFSISEITPAPEVTPPEKKNARKPAKNKQIQQDIAETFAKLEKKQLESEGITLTIVCLLPLVTRVCMMITANRELKRDKTPDLESGKSFCPITVLIQGTSC